MSLQVETLSVDAVSADWQTFVDAHPSPGPCHHAGWLRVMAKCFSVTPHWLMAREHTGEVVGVLPLYESRSIVFGSELTSLEGGILAKSAEAAGALFDAAEQLRHDRHLPSLVLRGGAPPQRPADGEQAYVHSVLPTDTPDSLWGALKSNLRRKIHKAEHEGLRMVIDNSAVGDFYAIYARNLRRLGTPVMTKSYFTTLTAVLADHVRFFTLLHNDRLTGGMLAIDHGAARTSLYVAVDEEAMRRYGTYALYWAVIEDCCRSARIVTLDLGRSVPHSGNHRFKRQWAPDLWIPYRTYGAVRQSLAASAGSAIAKALWARLPLALCNAVGPTVRKHQPFG